MASLDPVVSPKVNVAVPSPMPLAPVAPTWNVPALTVMVPLKDAELASIQRAELVELCTKLMPAPMALLRFTRPSPLPLFVIVLVAPVAVIPVERFRILPEALVMLRSDARTIPPAPLIVSPLLWET